MMSIKIDVLYLQGKALGNLERVLLSETFAIEDRVAQNAQCVDAT